ncbi:MAG: GAF domain-containing protein [Rhodoblastus sp.]
MSTAQDIHARLTMPKRLEALERSGLMDSEEEEDFDRVTRLAQALIGCDICLVSLVDDQRQFFKSSQGLPEDVRAARQTPLSHSFCKIVVATEQPLVVEDARADVRVADNPAVRELDVISYLGIPILGPEGETLGSFCAIDRRPRVWSEAEQAAMRDFTHLLENVIRVRIHARDAIRAATSNAVLAREYNHRIKNSYAVSAGLVRAAGRNADSIEALVRDCADRFASLGRAQDLILGEHATTDLGHVVAAVLKPFAYGGNCRIDGPHVTLDAAQVTPLALLLHELATNSIKYGALRDGRDVKVDWRVEAPEASLAWREPTGFQEDDVAGFGTKVLEIAARQLSGRMTRGYADGVLHVETTFPVETAAAGDQSPA